MAQALSHGLGTGFGDIPAERCARQMRQARVRTALRKMFVPKSLREAAVGELSLKR